MRRVLIGVTRIPTTIIAGLMLVYFALVTLLVLLLVASPVIALVLLVLHWLGVAEPF